jgi:hypothetical protein
MLQFFYEGIFERKEKGIGPDGLSRVERTAEFVERLSGGFEAIDVDLLRNSGRTI